MIPEELYKRRRRHNNTPSSMLLVLANYIVLAVAISLFTSCNHINWFFWVVAGFLALYNFFNIRRNREEYSRIIIIGYITGVILMLGIAVYWITFQNCS
jgi:hypothetical protein